MTRSKVRLLFLLSAAVPGFCLSSSQALSSRRGSARNRPFIRQRQHSLLAASKTTGSAPTTTVSEACLLNELSGPAPRTGGSRDLAGRTKAPRTLVYDLSNPATPESPQQSVITINNTHGQVYDLSVMAVGETRYVRAAFHLIIDRVDYVLRFGQSPTDGSSALEVTRISASQFHVKTGEQGDVVRMLRGNGPGEVLLGTVLPLDLTLTDQ